MSRDFEATQYPVQSKPSKAVTIDDRRSVSVLIATYNMMNTICEAIDSCIRNLPESEVVVVDDGSTDDTIHVLEEKYYNNPQVKIYHFTENRGKVSAFNEAYKNSTGKIVTLLGADDVLLPGRSVLLSCKLSNEHPQFWIGNYLDADANLNVRKRVRVLEGKWPNILERNCYPGGCSAFNRLFADLVFPIDEGLKNEDYLLAMLACYLGCDEKLESDFLIYRRHLGSTWGGASESEMIKAVALRNITILNAFNELIELNGADSLTLQESIRYNKLIANWSFPFSTLGVFSIPTSFSRKASFRLIFGPHLYPILGSIQRWIKRALDRVVA